MITSAQVVKTSVSVTTNSPSQDYTYLDDHNLPTYGVEQSLIAIKLSFNSMPVGFFFVLRGEQQYSIQINVKKILAVINATYAVAKRKPEKIRLAGIRTLTSAIPVQCSNQLS